VLGVALKGFLEISLCTWWFCDLGDVSFNGVSFAFNGDLMI
jgi:hypothetical protein